MYIYNNKYQITQIMLCNRIIYTIFLYIICGGQLTPYVQIALERAGPNIRSEDKRVSEDDQQRKR